MSFKVKVFDEQTDTVAGMIASSTVETPIKSHEDVIDGLHTLFAPFSAKDEEFERIHVLIRGYKSNGDVTYVCGNIPDEGSMQMAMRQYVDYGPERIKEVDTAAGLFISAIDEIWHEPKTIEE